MSQFTFLPTLADGLLYQHEILATAKIDQAMPGVSIWDVKDAFTEDPLDPQ